MSLPVLRKAPYGLRLIVVFENQKEDKFFIGNDYYNESLQKLILLVSRVKLVANFCQQKIDNPYVVQRNMGLITSFSV